MKFPTMRQVLSAAAVALLVGGAAGALAQQTTITLPYVPSVQATDAFQDLQNGQIHQGNTYATAAQLAAYVRGIGSGSYVDNLIENSDFSVDQVNAGASVNVATSLGRCIDRWYAIYTVSSSGGAAPTCRQVALSTGLTQTTDELKITGNSSATTSATAGMITYVQQTVEASDMEDLQWGQTAVLGQQQPAAVTVSLWLKSSIASANIGVAIKGASTVQSYVTNCPLSSTAATWTQCVFTVPAPTTGTWTTAIGSAGPVLTFAAQCGTTFQTTAGSWQTGGPFYCTSAQTQQLAVASSTLEIAAVKMQRGTSATAYGVAPYSIELNKLRRYYVSTFPTGTAVAQSAGLAGALESISATATANTLGLYWRFPVQMYAAPTVTAYNPAAANTNCRDITTTATALTSSVDPDSVKSGDGVFVACVGTPAAADHYGIHLSADAGL